jgi:hypothetical protein
MKKFALIALAAAAGTASAQFTINVPVSDSFAGLGNPNNGVTTAVYNGPNSIFSNVRIQGTLNDGGVGSWASEARWNIGNTSFGTSVNYQSTTQTGGFTTVAIDASFGGLYWANTGDTFRAESFESFVDSAAAPDAQWVNTTIEYSTAPTIVSLGNYNEGSFDLNTFGSNFDTEIALFSLDGTLIATNDDTGGLQSQVIETLGIGSYIVVIGGFNSSFGDGVALAGAAFGDYELNINGSLAASGTTATREFAVFQINVIPSPSSAALLGLGGLMTARRRR